MSKETYSTSGMKCPECGCVNEPEESCDYDDSCVQWCGECGVEFHSSCHISHSWSCKISSGDIDG